MSEAKLRFDKWKTQSDLDAVLELQLEEINGNDALIQDAFYKDLEFGTAGLRGIMGPGTNRMNIYVVRKATQGLANYMNKTFSAGTENPVSVAIAYDTRINSILFAKNAARVFAANGIKVRMFSEPFPLPGLSYAIRKYKCEMGLMITASHNPKDYNGYKVFNSNGSQILDDEASAILKEIQSIDIFNGIKTLSSEEMANAPFEVIGEAFYGDYCRQVLGSSLPWGKAKEMIDCMATLPIVYTPLNGAGTNVVKNILHNVGVTNILTVPSQDEMNGEFLTCPNPNPEKQAAFEEAAKVCEASGASVIIANDPDCDRTGMVVKENAQYHLLSGNQIATLLLDYIIKMRLKNSNMPKEPVLIRTIVSTPLVDEMLKSYDNFSKDEKHFEGSTLHTLIGFKYIGDKINQLEAAGKEQDFIFAFEEGNGFLIDSYVRDKDGVGTAMLLSQMAAYHKSRGFTLLQALDSIYQKYGYYKEAVVEFVFEGAVGMNKMNEMMKAFRKKKTKDLFGKKPIAYIDYLKRKQKILSKENSVLPFSRNPKYFPSSNILEFHYPEGKILMRPSGTEPKLKLYLFTKQDNRKSAEDVILEFKAKINSTMAEYL
ncbi:MAG: phospho-sugar mutase [Anaerovoracaceae bacterium]